MSALQERGNFVVDIHAHIGDYANFYMPDSSLERLFSIYDQCHTRCCIVSHIAGLYSHNFEYANKITAEVVEAYPGRIYGYAVYDPHYAESSLADVKKYIHRKGFCGVKVYPSGHAYPLDGEQYQPLWEFASREDVRILAHTWDPNPKSTDPFDWDSLFAQPMLLSSVAERFPDLRVVMAHTGGHYDGNRQAIKAAKTHKNLHVDICGEPIEYGFIEWVVGELGSDKIMYGSDQNWIDPRAMVGRVLAASISTVDKEKILFKNAEKFFGSLLA